MRYEVRNAGQTLIFDGEKIAGSSSRTPTSVRWVEFNLYRTVGGTYILERIGRSLVFHGIDCSVVRRNKLRFDPTRQELSDEHLACLECNPYDDDDLIIEQPRYFGMKSDDPEAVIDAAHKADRVTGARYLTNVTRKLIEEAAANDPRINNAYRVVYVD